MGANLLMVGMGMAFASSGFLIPRLENPDSGFGISLEQGSWLGKWNCFAGPLYLIYDKIDNWMQMKVD